MAETAYLRPTRMLPPGSFAMSVATLAKRSTSAVVNGRRNARRPKVPSTWLREHFASVALVGTHDRTMAACVALENANWVAALIAVSYWATPVGETATVAPEIERNPSTC